MGGGGILFSQAFQSIAFFLLPYVHFIGLIVYNLQTLLKQNLCCSVIKL